MLFLLSNWKYEVFKVRLFQVMIYLVEAVLPEGYFADDLRGLSADMAAFRDLLKLRLPRLAQHMDYLQKISDGKQSINEPGKHYIDFGLDENYVGT